MMNCAWKELLAILPEKLRYDVDKLGKEDLQEIRLRFGQKPELILRGKSAWLQGIVTRDDLMYCINTASQYSPWNSSSISKGYLTAAGGHRIGLCGEVVVKNGKEEGIRNVTSLCIRVARDFPNLAAGVVFNHGSTLIIGPPGSGKTTLLRDLIRQKSDFGQGSVAVVDERGELFPINHIFPQGKRTDILNGCEKRVGIEMALRTMGPACIAVDEITADEDCDALLQACWCGVEVLATLHGRDASDLAGRAVYKPILVSKLFQNLVILRKDQSFRIERMVE